MPAAVEKVFNPGKTLYLIDGSSFSYRSFFAIKDLTNSKGLPTGAVYGFLNTLKKIINQFSPQYLGICFDVSRKTFRQEKFKDYKASRPPIPDDLKLQMSWIKNIIKSLNIAIAELEGYEGDDLIATLARKAKDAGFRCIIFSPDKDILQLVEDNKIMVYNSNKDLLLDEEAVFKALKIKPVNIPDLLALSGDSIDNIPGVKGIGPKGASYLIEHFGSVENLIKNAQDIPKDSMKKLILQSEDIITLSKELAVLDAQVPLDLSIDDLKIGKPDYDQLCRLLRELDFKSLVKDFSATENDSDLPEVPSRDFQAGLSGNIKDSKKLIFYLKAGDLFLYFDDSVYKVDNPEETRDLFENPQIKKVSFDIKGALVNLAKRGINISKPYFDVMVASFLLKTHLQDLSLENIVWEYLETSSTKISEPKKVIFLSKLYEVLEAKLAEGSLQKLFYDIEMPLVEVLAWMEQSSISIDLANLEDSLVSSKNRQASLEKEILKEAGLSFNLNSPKQLSEILFTKLKLKPVKRTKTGFSTNEEVLIRLKGKHPIIEKLLEYRKLTKLLSTYIEPFLSQAKQNNAKISPNFSQVSSSTGRLVSFSPNLQNIPIREPQAKAIRSAFISSFRSGCILSADYSQIELRVLAHISQDERLIEAFGHNKDIHRYTGSLLFSKNEEDISPRQREFAKRINFAIVYGMSPYGLSKELGIPLEEADNFISQYFMRYSGVNEYVRTTQLQAQENGFVTTLFGRRRNLENINSYNKSLKEYALRQAVNAPIQGTAADIIKLAMIKIFQLFRMDNLKSRMIIQIHDELVFDVEPGEVDKVKNLVLGAMENVVSLKVPLRVNMQNGRTWLEATK